MSQINLTKTATFETPTTDRLGLGFNSLGQLVKIKTDGSTEVIGGTDSGSSNIIANLGVGDTSDLPENFTTGDVYVASDFYKIYTAESSLAWVVSDLSTNQLITDTSDSEVYHLYQYDGIQLILLTNILDSNISLFDAANSTPSGLQTNVSGALVELTAYSKALQEQFSSTASAAAYIQGAATPVLVTTTESILDIEKAADDTNTELIEVDEVNNLIYLKEAGTYPIIAEVTLTNASNNSAYTATIKSINNDDDTVITTRDIEVAKNTSITIPKLVNITVTEATTVKINVLSDTDTELTIDYYIANITINSASGSGISHADSDGYAYASKDGYWEATDKNEILTLGSTVASRVLDMGNLIDYYINLSSTLSGCVISTTAPTNTATSRKKNVIVNNSTGVAITVTITADVYENGMSSSYSFVDGKTRLYFRYFQGVVYVGLVDYSETTDLSAYATEQAADLTNASNAIDIDCNSRNNFIGTNRVAISADATITFSNETNVRFMTFKVNITNSATVTFPTNSISSDDNWDTLIWTAPEDGYYTVSIYKTTGEYEIVFTQGGAV